MCGFLWVPSVTCYVPDVLQLGAHSRHDILRHFRLGGHDGPGPVHTVACAQLAIRYVSERSHSVVPLIWATPETYTCAAFHQ